jgi:hypothetical protein
MMTGVQVGDRVVFLDDEPSLELTEGAQGTVTAIRGDDVEFELSDGRVFVTDASSLDAAPAASASNEG